MASTQCYNTCLHLQRRLNRLAPTHPHTVVSMNMRRVTPVLIVNNDCSHGPSPPCCDAVPLSIAVAAPPVTLHCHCDRRALHTQRVASTTCTQCRVEAEYISGGLIKNELSSIIIGIINVLLLAFLLTIKYDIIVVISF